MDERKDEKAEEPSQAMKLLTTYLMIGSAYMQKVREKEAADALIAALDGTEGNAG